MEVLSEQRYSAQTFFLSISHRFSLSLQQLEAAAGPGQHP